LPEEGRAKTENTIWESSLAKAKLRFKNSRGMYSYIRQESGDDVMDKV